MDAAGLDAAGGAFAQSAEMAHAGLLFQFTQLVLFLH